MYSICSLAAVLVLYIPSHSARGRGRPAELIYL